MARKDSDESRSISFQIMKLAAINEKEMSRTRRGVGMSIPKLMPGLQRNGGERRMFAVWQNAKNSKLSVQSRKVLFRNIGMD